MPLALLDRDHFDVEAVRLDNGALTREKGSLGFEGKAIDLTIQPLEDNSQIDRSRIDRFTVSHRVDPELRRHAVLENRHLERKVAVLEQAPVVRTLFIFGCLDNFSFGGCFAPPTGREWSHQQESPEAADQGRSGHRLVSVD